MLYTLFGQFGKLKQEQNALVKTATNVFRIMLLAFFSVNGYAYV